MTETVVHVTTIDQWKSVLDVWFEQGYTWQTDDRSYSGFIFSNRVRYLHLNSHISYTLSAPKEFIEYSDFMAQQEKTMAKETYYVTQEQLDFLNTMYEELYSLDELLNRHTEARNLFDDFSIPEGNAVLRYLGGDTSVEFKVKEQLYRLSGFSLINQLVYFDKNSILLPATTSKENAFTAPLEEIKKWKTPDWEIEKAD